MATSSRKSGASAGNKGGKGGSSTSPKGGIGAGLQELEQVLQLMARHQVAELEWENHDMRVHLKTNAAVASTGAAPGFPMGSFLPHPTPAPASVAAPAPKPAPAAAEAPAAPSAKPAANQKQITSPFVGTFYRQSSPGADPYVREGSVVKRGDVLCIIEAMKLMNEIESEFSGKIVSILVENGQPVEFGEPLFLIET